MTVNELQQGVSAVRDAIQHLASIVATVKSCLFLFWKDTKEQCGLEAYVFAALAGQGPTTPSGWLDLCHVNVLLS